MTTKSCSLPFVTALLVVVALMVSPVSLAQGGSAAQLPTAERILVKYEAFLGGAAALSKVTTRTVRTRRLTVVGEPTDHLLLRQSKRPMYSIMGRFALDGPFLRYTNGCDGTSGWEGADENGKPRSGEATTDGICEQEAYYYGYLPLDLVRAKGNVRRFEVKAVLPIVPMDPGSWGALAGGNGRDLIPAGARQAYLVLSVPARSGDNYAWLYFDVETGALLRRAEAGSGASPDAAGSNPRVTDFIQYRDVGDGTRAPFQFVTYGANSQVRGVHVSITDNETIGDDVFVRPKDVRRQDKGL
jgi:hypothetical protein